MWPFRWMMHQKRGLRMWVLTMLSAGPKNGVEIMNEIESMTRGWWRPSPGSIYPLLDQLSEEGLLRKRPDGRYELTEKAEGQGDWPFGPGPRAPRSVREALTELGANLSYLEDLAQRDPKELEENADRVRELGDRLAKIGRGRSRAP